jgi:hypothetical protein
MAFGNDGYHVPKMLTSLALQHPYVAYELSYRVLRFLYESSLVYGKFST